MFDLVRLGFGVIVRLFRSRETLLIENLVLRQQLPIFKRKHNPTNDKKIAYGIGNPTSQTCTAIGSYITAKPCTVTLYDSQNGNAVLSQTWNSYDQYGNLTQTWSLVSGTGASGNYLSKSYTYLQGVVQTATDVNGEVTMYTPTSCNDMFVTRVVSQ